MKIVLIILQIAAGGMFLLSGFGKFTMPYEEMTVQMEWAKLYSPVFIKTISALEMLGGLGLLLTLLIKALPRILAPLAALGLFIIMLGAFVSHLIAGDFVPMGIANIVLGTALAFIASKRYKEMKEASA